jgi:thiol:disulfide interchange protein DsbA
MLRLIALSALLVVGAAQAAPANTDTVLAPVKTAPSLTAVDTNRKYTEGKEYRLVPANAASSPTAKALLDTHQGKVEVIDFFSYGCPVCNRIEPDVEKWSNSKKDTQMIAFVDVPVDWPHPGWENLARAFYIAETLNVLDKAHPALFNAIHVQGKNFKNQADLEEFFLTQVGVSRDKFNEAFDSFNVRRRLKQGELLRDEYAVMAIPAFIVNGKYYVDVQTAGGTQQAINVVDYLVSKESFVKGTDEITFDDVKPKSNATAVQPNQPLVPSTK